MSEEFRTERRATKEVPNLIPGPVDKSEHEQMTERIRELEAENKKLRDQLEALHLDPLTGLERREQLEATIASFLPSKGRDPLELPRHVSVIYADIDYFKSVNDRFDHAMGDEVLRKVAQVLRESVRKSDIIGRLGNPEAREQLERRQIAGRLGGEELVVALIGVTEEEAAQKAEELKGKIAALRFGEANLRVTASFGVATSDRNEPTSVQDLLKRADAAMYFAKQNGRDRVVTESKKREEEARQGSLDVTMPQHPAPVDDTLG